jgi:type 1 fimbriae regulatory protein FimB
MEAKIDIMLHSHQIQVPVTPPGSKKPKRSMIFLEPVEVLSVLRSARAKGSREWAMILLAYKHGMRASEVCNLRLDDVDIKNGSIVVQRLKGSLLTTQAMTEHRGEPLLNEIKALREWLRQRTDDGSDILFTSQKGGRLDRSQFFRLFQTVASAAGLPAEKQHPHALKHSIANHLVSANVNLALVKQQLGHKSIGSTMRYINTSDRQASKATASALMKIY